MIEEYFYENYSINFKENYSTKNEAYYFIFNNKRELYLSNNSIPYVKEDNIKDLKLEFQLYIGKYKQKEVIVANTNIETEDFHNLFEIYDINHEDYQMASRAVLVRDWYMSHKYCGHCGTKTIIDKKDMMLICPKCGQMHYPRIAPAIIVTINNNDKLLMAKHSYHKTHSYSLIAGFVEAGESIEEAVRREVKEEVGIEIKNIRYVKSQPWPFPNSLMLGFTADYDSGEIKVDGDEILEAKWFKPEEIEIPSSTISISSWLINEYIKNHKG
ncbi:NAD(+) diphosphatase [Methanosphaera sp. ISO3-F5]|uniref:NAD(+) diphosphatase n=1 Tax=Methanosphaera sp. ISO3-F5 TaxID=1452353 RepID=UPI002B2638B8|nr:NAD(+) diphosphatase [Methanosphaera sp. ISO3-F5]WQH63997.1 NAD(+) diphosphatase [Methanosphaera sp. ISO3-F5]